MEHFETFRKLKKNPCRVFLHFFFLIWFKQNSLDLIEFGGVSVL